LTAVRWWSSTASAAVNALAAAAGTREAVGVVHRVVREVQQ